MMPRTRKLTARETAIAFGAGVAMFVVFFFAIRAALHAMIR
jgi:hypothetical protein